MEGRAVVANNAAPLAEALPGLEADTDLASLLARIEREHPAAAAAAVAAEVDRVLGRPPKPAVRTPSINGRRPAQKDKDATDLSAFEWYQAIFKKLPPLLSHDRAVAAAIAVEVGLLAEERLDSDEPIPAHLRRDLRQLAQHGRAEFDLLITSNLRLVFHWCKGVASSVGPDWVQDAFQAGCIGLIRGLQGWDYRRGYQLSTFVSWHIRQQIQRWRWNETSIIRLPVHVWEKLDDGFDSLSPQIRDAARQALRLASLDDEDLDLDGATPLVETGASLDDLALHIERERGVDELLSHLDHRSAHVIRLRHGLALGQGEPMTLDAIGEIYGVTRERIRQIEKKGMEALIGLARARDLDALL